MGRVWYAAPLTISSEYSGDGLSASRGVPPLRYRWIVDAAVLLRWGFPGKSRERQGVPREEPRGKESDRSQARAGKLARGKALEPGWRHVEFGPVSQADLAERLDI